MVHITENVSIRLSLQVTSIFVDWLSIRLLLSSDLVFSPMLDGDGLVSSDRATQMMVCIGVFQVQRTSGKVGRRMAHHIPVAKKLHAGPYGPVAGRKEVEENLVSVSN